LIWYICYSFLHFIPDEKERVWLAAQAHANDIHHTDIILLVGSMTVPCNDPHWNYQDPDILATRNYMLTYLLAGLQTASYKAVNFDKLREIIQCPTENPADFLGHLTKALTCYTMLNPSSKDGIIVLHSHFISQSFPNI
jgi:hypothetical protein